MNQSYTYVDGIDNIVMIEGIVRLDMITLARGTNDKPSPTKTGGIALSLPAFIRTYQQMGNVMDNMVKQGLIKRRDAEGVAPDVNVVEVSPNADATDAAPSPAKNIRKR